MSTSYASETQEKSAQRMYDERAANYDSSWHPSFARRFVGWADLKPGQTVLDLACGTGLVAVPAAQTVGPGGRVVAIDVSHGMLEEARKKVQALQLQNVQIIQYDITRIDEIDALKGMQFDAITMASALVLLTDEDRLRAGDVWVSMLKPGGVFVVDVLTPNNQTSGLLLERAAKKLGRSVPYNRDWVKTKLSVEEYLSSFGLLHVQSLEVQQTGEETAWARVDESDSYLEKMLSSEAAKALSTGGESTLEQLRSAFREEWQSISDAGKVKIEDAVWVFIAKKDFVKIQSLTIASAHEHLF